MTNYPCDYCGESYDPEIQGHYDENTYLKFCCQECENDYDSSIGLPENYDRCDDHPPFCDTKCDQCKNSLPDCHTFEPIDNQEGL